MVCWSCGNNFDGEIFRTSVCPSCKKDLHSCYNCRFYSEGSHYDCSETVEDIVTDKEKANFCDFFKAGANSKIKSGSSSAGSDARAKAEALFGGTVSDTSKSGKDAFDALFG